MKLKEIRKRKNVSQKDLGQLINTTPEAISKYERRISDPSIENLIKMADYLEVSVDTLVGHDANIVDLTLMDENRRNLITKIANELSDDEVSRLLGFMYSFKK